MCLVVLAMFLLSSIEDGALAKLSPFAIQKAIVGLAGEPKPVNLKKTGLVVECNSEKHSTCLLKSTIFCNVSIKVTIHQRESLDADNWKETVRRKSVKIYPHMGVQQ